MKKIYTILFVLLAVIGISCEGKEKVKPSADYLLTTEAINRLEIIKNAYQEKDAGTLQRQIDTKLAESILKNLNFEKAELSFTPRMLKITDVSVIVNINWQGIWRIAQDKKLENRGSANLALQRDTLKLIQVEGDNPFQIPKLGSEN
ncbi:MAG: hypothetical protein HZB30_05795 [Nitrospirae bacterium]|nr:hypothetical protein [Nitrospirota bacterium]